MENTTRTYYAGATEKTVTVGGETVERTRIGDSVVHLKTTRAATDLTATATSAFEYLHRDHLGSVEAVTDASGNELAVLGHSLRERVQSDPIQRREPSKHTRASLPWQTGQDSGIAG